MDPELARALIAILAAVLLMFSDRRRRRDHQDLHQRTRSGARSIRHESRRIDTRGIVFVPRMGLLEDAAEIGLQAHQGRQSGVSKLDSAERRRSVDVFERV